MKVPSNLVILGVIAALIIGGAFAVSIALASPGAQQTATGTPGTATAGTGAVMATGTTQAQGTPVPPLLVRVWNSMCVEGVPYTLLSVPLDAKFALVIPQAANSTTGTAVPVTGGLKLPSGTVIASGTGAASSSGTAMPSGSSTAMPSGTSFVGGTAAPTETMTPQASTGSGTPQASNGTAIVPVTGAESSSNKGTLGQVPAQNSCTGLGQVSGLQLIICTGPEGNPYTLYVHDVNGTQTYNGTLWDCSKLNKTTSSSSSPASTALPVGSGTAPAATLPPTAAPTNPPAATSTP